MFEAFGPDESMQLYDRGIRRRLAPMLHGDRRRLELAYSLMFTLPGTPVHPLRRRDRHGRRPPLPERNCARTPMQWSTEPHGGFTRADEAGAAGDRRRAVYGYQRVNVAEQRRDPNSLLNWTERIIRMRKECPEIGWGDWTVLGTRTPARAGACATTGATTRVVVLHNFVARAAGGDLRGRPRGGTLVNLLSEDHSRADGRGQHRLELEGYGYRWFRVGGLAYILKRER